MKDLRIKNEKHRKRILQKNYPGQIIIEKNIPRIVYKSKIGHNY